MYKRKLIKLGKSSKVVVIPLSFLKKCSEYPNINEVIIEEYPEKLEIKFIEAKNELAKN